MERQRIEIKWIDRDGNEHSFTNEDKTENNVCFVASSLDTFVKSIGYESMIEVEVDII